MGLRPISKQRFSCGLFGDYEMGGVFAIPTEIIKWCSEVLDIALGVALRAMTTLVWRRWRRATLKSTTMNPLNPRMTEWNRTDHSPIWRAPA